MIPLLVLSAAVLKALPDQIGGEGGESCEWVEVGVVARSLVDICEFIGKRDDGEWVYNIVHPKSFSWAKEFLPKLREAGMDFETVEYMEWLKKLSKSEVDVAKNPSKKLLGFWQSQGIRQSGLKEGVITFDTTSLIKISPTIKDAERVVDGQLVKEIVNAWREAGASI